MLKLTDQSSEIVVVNFDQIPVISTNSDPMVSASPVTNSVDATPSSSCHEPDVGISVSTSPTHVKQSILRLQQIPGYVTILLRKTNLMIGLNSTYLLIAMGGV